MAKGQSRPRTRRPPGPAAAKAEVVRKSASFGNTGSIPVVRTTQPGLKTAPMRSTLLESGDFILGRGQQTLDWKDRPGQLTLLVATSSLVGIIYSEPIMDMFFHLLGFLGIEQPPGR